MKKINNLLVLVSIVSSLLIIFLLNKEMIPLHFNKLGVVDRYGSKFELLLMPFFVIIIYLIVLDVFQKKKAQKLYIMNVMIVLMKMVVLVVLLMV